MGKLLLPSEATRVIQFQEKKVNDLVLALEAATKECDFQSNAARVIRESTDYDRLGTANFLSKVKADMNTVQGGATDTIMIKRAGNGRVVHDDSSAKLPAAIVSA